LSNLLIITPFRIDKFMVEQMKNIFKDLNNVLIKRIRQLKLRSMNIQLLVL